jgi:serine/threonine protein kinase
MAPETPIVGQVLGHYRVLEQIGVGGMGLVFRASDQQLERDVAIKVLPPGMLADEAARKRFRREALTLAKTARWRRGRPGNRPNRVASNVGILIFCEQPDQVTSDFRIKIKQLRSGRRGGAFWEREHSKT